MKLNLLIPKTLQQLYKRLVKLSPWHKSYWGNDGSYTNADALHLCNPQLPEEKHDFKKPTLKQRFRKVLGLYLKAHFPRNRNGATRNETIGKIPSTAFYKQLNKCKSIINLFSQHSKPMPLVHPVLGSLYNTQCRIAARKHMDHHLRQFGV